MRTLDTHDGIPNPNRLTMLNIIDTHYDMVAYAEAMRESRLKYMRNHS